MSIKRIGIDVSKHQGIIDWNEVAKHIDFAIIRLGYGQNTLDEQAARNISECKRLGIPYGVYWFSYAYSVERAKNEARNAIARLKELGGVLSYPFFFDWEYESRDYVAGKGYTVSNQLLLDMATAFCNEVESAGYYAGIYANQDYHKNYYGEEIFKRYDLWLADLSGTEQDVHMHQYSFNGNVDGISTNVDMDYCHVDFPTIIASMCAKKVESKEEHKEPTVKIDGAKSFDKTLAHTYKVRSVIGLKLRSGPSIQKTILETMPNGSAFTCYGYHTGNWLYGISASGKKGYAHKSLLKK